MAYTAPRGTVDLLIEDTTKWQKLEQILRTISDLYNVKEIRTPILEHTELFNRSVGDTSDVVTKEMYTFEDKKGRSITLRPEGTAGVARAFVENKLFSLPDKPMKLYYMGPMFRYERPQKGRQRQFHQFGVEMLGVENPALDVEAMCMAVTIVKALGLKNVRLVINTLGDSQSRDMHKQALKAHFKPYLDELCYDCNQRFEKNPLRILDCKVDKEHEAMKTAPKTLDYLTDESKAYFDEVCSLLDDLEVEYEVDPNLVRGLDYYCHVVFEVISDDPILGAQATLGGGGRYNSMIEELGGPATPGIGFAFGMERLTIALGNEEANEEDGLDVYVMPLGAQTISLSAQILAMLRANGFKADMDYNKRGMKAMFKTVDRTHARFAMIIGEDEALIEVVNIKDTFNRTQDTVKLEDIISYLEKKMEE